MKNILSKKASLLLMSVLIAAMTLCSLGCGKASTTTTTSTSTEVSVSTVTSTETSTETSASTEASVEDTTAVSTETTDTDATLVGEGNTEFTFTVVDGEGKETVFTVKTDETTVGAALVKLELISGDESEYGLYVKNVNGITADWDVDGHYWAFYINGEYAMTGVDATDITAGATYTFKVE